MNLLRNFNLNLGIPTLIPEWKQFFSKKYLLDDLIAGTTVAFVAIPLSLAIALASGVSPGIGLITAIVAGIVCALFGGTTLAVSGPAAAMTVLVSSVAETHGYEGLVFVCLLAGLLQLASGMLGIGKLGRYVPLPVVAGFTAGIGVIILINQLPRAFGLLPPSESHTFDVINHIRQYFHEIKWHCLALVILTIGIIRGLPKILPSIPPILPAVIISALIVYFFNLGDVPLIGAIPNSLPSPQFPELSKDFQSLFVSTLAVYVLASLETLLSCSAIDKMANGKKHDANQELIGQGMGNIAVSLFGGIPVTSVIARSATNIRAGGKTRRSSIIHSLIILLAVYAISPLISLIPVAALAGVLFSVAFSMINYKEFHELWVTSRAEGLIYAVTFLTIIFVDLIAGVQVGIAAACAILLFNVTRTHLHISTTTHDDIVRLSLLGPLTFLSAGNLTKLEQKLKHVIAGQTIILDLSSVTSVDASGASSIVDLYNQCKERNIEFYIKGLPRRFENLFRIGEYSDLIDNRYLISEHDLRKKNGSNIPRSARGRLVHGVSRFYLERKYNDKRLFEHLTDKQDPHTLFIACSDSRMVPSMITSSDPGELFIVRNVGNFIPPYDQNDSAFHSEAAAIEFALSTFDITDIVVCGHANCGAMRACTKENLNDLPINLRGWIAALKSKLVIDKNQTIEQLAQSNVINQIQNLQEYPIVKQKLAEQTLTIHAWFFDFDQSYVYEWDSKTQQFHLLKGDLH